MSINRFNIICPQNAADETTPTMDEFKAAFGIKDDPPPSNPPQDTPPADTPPDDKPPENNPPQDQNQNPGNPPQSNPPDTTQNPPANPPADKTAQAFAQMRVQNKQFQNVINGVAKILGVNDTSNPDVVMTKLNDLILKAEAKNNNVPEEVYKRLQTLEQQNQDFTQKQVREQAYFGFQKVKDTFKLDDAGLNRFADDLLKSGVNPFETPVDLLKEYQTMHFNDLIQAAVQLGIKQEAERAANAANHSSTPNQRQGQGVTDPEKITSVTQLTAWFDKQGQK